MGRRIYDLDQPDRFVTGTVGQPGNRVFFLQARKASTVISVVVEKVQVQALADRLALLLAELARRGFKVPEALAPHDDDTSPLDEPLVEAFRVGTMTIAWDPDREHVILEARAQEEDEDGDDEDEDEDEDEDDEPAGDIARALGLEVVGDEDDDEDEDEDDDEPSYADDDPDGPDLVRVRLTPLRVRSFIERALRVVAAGRPPCPLCGRPLEPTGHLCPRRNGYVH